VIAPSYANAGDFIGDVFVSRVRLYAFGLSLLVAGLLFLFLNRSATGRAIRAASENWEAATYMGIDIDRTNRIAFGVGVALTAVGGAALVTFQSITPFVGLRFVVVMFAAVVLGGLRSVGGAFVGGVLIGIIQSVSQVWTSAAVKNVWVFALFLLIPALAAMLGRDGGALSGGQQQMLAVARGVMACPRLLMLDEPSMGLAPRAADDIFEGINRLLESETTAMVVVEQRAHEALEICDRAYVLESGEVVLEASGQALLADERLAAAYLGSEL
jgi:ABC-type branched-subunit amino acid transport system ATPase component